MEKTVTPFNFSKFEKAKVHLSRFCSAPGEPYRRIWAEDFMMNAIAEIRAKIAEKDLTLYELTKLTALLAEYLSFLHLYNKAIAPF